MYDKDEHRQHNGDLDYVAEIPLGCFGKGHSGVELDRCCDSACDGKCKSGLEACVRARVNPVCAHPSHTEKDGHTTCTTGPPMCTPRNFEDLIV